MQKILVSAYVDKENRNINLELHENTKVKELLSNLNINPVTVIVSRDNELILEDETLKNKDKLKILSVISGG